MGRIAIAASRPQTADTQQGMRHILTSENRVRLNTLVRRVGYPAVTPSIAAIASADLREESVTSRVPYSCGVAPPASIANSGQADSRDADHSRRANQTGGKKKNSEQAANGTIDSHRSRLRRCANS